MYHFLIFQEFQGDSNGVCFRSLNLIILFLFFDFLAPTAGAAWPVHHDLAKHFWWGVFYLVENFKNNRDRKGYSTCFHSSNPSIFPSFWRLKFRCYIYNFRRRSGRLRSTWNHKRHRKGWQGFLNLEPPWISAEKGDKGSWISDQSLSQTLKNASPKLKT